MKGVYRFVTVPLALVAFAVTVLPLFAVGVFLSSENQTRLGYSYRDFLKGVVELFD